MDRVQLIANDRVTLEVSLDVINMSSALKNALEDSEDGERVIPVPNVSSAILAKVITFCETYSKEPLDATLSAVTKDDLFDIILAANYLDITPLMDHALKVCADTIKGMSPDQVRTYFCLEKDMTDEEEAAIKSQYSWAFEAQHH
jgi:S-phase kinase-associated protein 1